MFDKPPMVTKFPALYPEPILQRGKRTNPAAERDQRPPEKYRDMKQRPPSLPKYQNPPKWNKEDKDQMNQDNQMSKNQINHRN